MAEHSDKSSAGKKYNNYGEVHVVPAASNVTTNSRKVKAGKISDVTGVGAPDQVGYWGK